MTNNEPKIIVTRRGPYSVEGGIPLVRKEPVVSEHGEPLTWRKGEVLNTGKFYTLCGCGESGTKPFCDGSHADSNFQHKAPGNTEPIDRNPQTYHGTGLVVEDDRSLCIHAGFCGNQATNVWRLVSKSSDTQIRAQIISMIERCPSGALTYSLEPNGENIEPDLPVEIAITPDGALWVSGNVPIEWADGNPLETRNRVALCRCGSSKNRPLCDGTHNEIGFSAK